jgi:putative inorganic carbon (hco3(-)) transporter
MKDRFADSLRWTFDLYRRHHWLGIATIVLFGVALPFNQQLVYPFIAGVGLLLYLQPGTKTFISTMFAVFPFMYAYTYVQSLQGVGLTSGDVPVLYRALKDVLVILVLTRATADVFIRGESRFRFGWTDLFVGLFFLETLATSVQSMAYGQQLLVAALGIRNTSFCVLAYFLARAYFTSRADYVRFVRVMFWTGLVVAVLGILQAVAIRLGVAATAFGTSGEQSSSFRVFSTMNDPNMYGMFLAACLLLARRDLLRISKLPRRLGAAILAVGLLLSLSFSVLLPLLVLLILYVLVMLNRKPKLALWGLVLLIFAFLAPGVSDRLVEIGRVTDLSLQFKLIQMQKALDVFLASPLLGAGYGVVGQSRAWVESENEIDSIAGEDYYLILAAQSGVVGVGLLLATLCVWWWERRKIRRMSSDSMIRSFLQGVAGVFLVFWLANLVTDHYEGFPNSFFVWFLMGAVVEAGRVGRPLAAPEGAISSGTPVRELTGA